MEPKNIVISKLKPEGEDKAAAFCKSIYEELGWDLRFKDGIDQLTEYFGKPREVILVVKIDNKIIGCGSIKCLTQNKGLLKRFYIDKEYRGSGVATLLLEDLIAFAQLQKYKYLVLDTRFDNLRAQRFYTKNKFKKIKSKPYEGWSESFAPKIFYYYRLKL